MASLRDRFHRRVFFVALPAVTGIRPHIVLSGSMEPEIPTGSLAFINTRSTEPKEGKIMMYAVGEGDSEILVTHRVIRINDDGSCIMQGDANDTPDLSDIRAEQFRGTYCFSIPRLGRIAAAIRKKQTLVCAWAAALVVGSFLLDAVFQGYKEEGLLNAKPKPGKF